MSGVSAPAQPLDDAQYSDLLLYAVSLGLGVFGHYLLTYIMMLIVNTEDDSKSAIPTFAPLSIPWTRRKQTFGLVFVISLPLTALGLNALVFWINNTFLYALYIIYIVWIFFWDRAMEEGGRVSKFVRKPTWTRLFKEYFPATLLQTEKLDPNQQYLFGYHPHGIIALSVWANFAGNNEEYLRVMKGIDLRIVTLKGNFFVPFFRDLVLGAGFIAATRNSIARALQKGCSVMVVIGGAAESLYAMPGNTNVVLKNRKGFVRLALQNGAYLVPCYGFGENELFNQSTRPIVRRFQQLMKRKLGWVMPVFAGRGIFNYSFGILPHRVALTSVLGKPIPVPRVENPSEEMVEHYHDLYVKALQKLYKDHKYLGDGDDDLNVID